ncbi:SIMPL domain-containing protein [Paraburkholderia aspalathi]|uniref:SIMPL domain-containing protein n=1 Tax=Paraburkholderia aspalathi TaxID=1324617 RepID=UPI0038BBBBF9
MPLLWPASADAAVSVENAALSEPTDELSLSVQAGEKVPQDTVIVTMFYETQAKNASSLGDLLNLHAAEALRIAKGVANVSVHSGEFTESPATGRDGRITVWRGRTEVMLESSDFAATSKLAARMSGTMQIGSVTFSVSPQARNAAGEELATRAIASFRKQAQANAQAFGYGGYVVRKVSVNTGAGDGGRQFAELSSAGGNDAGPVGLQAGTETVTVQVSGSVRMMH